MKKIGSILFALVLCVMNSSCLKRDSLEDINIYTSNYAISYIAERLYGERNHPDRSVGIYAWTYSFRRFYHP